MNKFIIYTILVLIGLYMSVWLFNHINAWVGIFSAILIIILVINILFDKIKLK